MATAETPAPAPERQWKRSEEYRSLFSNVWQYRIGRGEVALLFSNSQAGMGFDGNPEIVQEVEIFVTWRQLKTIYATLTMVFDELEAVVGPIPVPSVSDEQRQALRDHLKANGVTFDED